MKCVIIYQDFFLAKIVLFSNFQLFYPTVSILMFFQWNQIDSCYVSLCSNCHTFFNSLCNTSFLYYLLSFKKETVCELNFEGTVNTTHLPMTCFLSRDQVTNWKHHSATITKATITNRGGNTYFLHVTWCNHVITWQTSGNTYQIRREPFLHFTWPDHANQSNQSYSL